MLAGWCSGDGEAIELDQPIRLTVSGVSIGPLDVEPPGTGISVEPAYVDASVFDQLVAAGAESSLSSVVWLADGSTEATTRSIDGFDGLIDVDERAADIDRALDTDARALWIMAVAGLVIGLLVLAPVIHRSISADAGDGAALAGLGASRFQHAVHVSRSHRSGVRRRPAPCSAADAVDPTATAVGSRRRDHLRSHGGVGSGGVGRQPRRTLDRARCRHRRVDVALVAT